MQFFPGHFRQMLGHVDEVGLGVVAKDEANTRIGVPVVEMLGLGKIRIAAKQHGAESAAETRGDGAIQGSGSAFVGRAIAGRLTMRITSRVLARLTSKG